jgi:two-component sensor histidine kinase
VPARIAIVCSEVMGSDPRVELNLNVETIIVPAHKAAVVALIVKELIANAIKYGCAGRLAVMASGRIPLRLDGRVADKALCHRILTRIVPK